MTNSALMSRWRSRRRMALFAGACLALGCAGAWVSLQLLRGYRTERMDVHPPVGVVELPPAAAQLGLKPFVVSTGATEVHGWFVAPHGGGTVVMSHGNYANRASLLNEALALVAGGHGIVLFDFPGHGESTGKVELAEPAQRALRVVIDATMKMDGVDSSRIGVYAFSFGGVTATREVATDARVRAVVLAATPVDLAASENKGLGAALRAAAGLWFWRRQGSPLDELSLMSVAGALAPRPVLVVYGDSDRVVPRKNAEELVRLIGASASLMNVAGAAHGGYTAADPTYGMRISEFFTRNLAPRVEGAVPEHPSANRNNR